MKTLIALTLFTLSAPAFAGYVHEFKCKTTDAIDTRNHRGVTRFSFSVKNLEQGKIGYVESEDPNGVTGPVTMVPENSALMLNDNYGINRSREKDLLLDSDGDGVQFTLARLYANANYRNGYAQVKYSDGQPGVYTKVTCQTKESK